MLLKPSIWGKVCFNYIRNKIVVVPKLLLLWVQRLIYFYTMILITSLILKNKYSWNTCASVFYANKKFEAFKEVLHSSAFQWSWFSYYLEEIYIYTVNLLTIRFRDCPICINYLKSIHIGKRRELITRSISIIHRY